MNLNLKKVKSEVISRKKKYLDNLDIVIPKRKKENIPSNG
jgi:hypothetical protein